MHIRKFAKITIINTDYKVKIFFMFSIRILENNSFFKKANPNLSLIGDRFGLFYVSYSLVMVCDFE